ncbi:MAG: hypothetical protein LBT84_02790 [Spirochaetia bacterium]|nr:hypothetical protein [Spirochaetia bacterium]
MEVRDFIYHFTDILFSEIVKHTILIESWDEKDFDHKYVEYTDAFSKIKDSYLPEDDNIVIERLNNSKHQAVLRFNEQIKEKFSDQLAHYGISESIMDLFPDIFNENTANMNILSTFRDLEEKALKGRQ